MDQLQSAEIKDIVAALAKVQSELTPVLKGSENPFFKSSYADLRAVWDAGRPLLQKNGLCVVQTTIADPVAGPCLVTTLAHVSGQWFRGVLPLNPVKNDPQGVGSAITYARRYAFAAIIGVTFEDEDDDGEAAMGRPRGQEGKANAITQKIAPAKPIMQQQTQALAVHKQTAPGGAGEPCHACGAELILSKAGMSYYCPNFKDTSVGEHTRIAAQGRSA